MKKRKTAYLLAAAMLVSSLGQTNAAVFAKDAVRADSNGQEQTEEESSLRSDNAPDGAGRDVSVKTYTFGSGDLTKENGAYTEEKKVGFSKVAFPEAAKDWVDGVYYPREASVLKGDTSYLNDVDGGLEIASKVWTEKEKTGYGVYTYEETDTFDIDCESADYTVEAEFFNPTSNAYTAYLETEDITKKTDIKVEAGKTVSVSVNASVVDGQLNIKFLAANSAASADSANLQNVYVSKVVVRQKETETAGAKPTIYLASDSTVQSYDKKYAPQTGWGQTLYENFGTPVLVNGNVERQENEVRPEWMTYETEDVLIQNRALGGRSSASYIQEGLFDHVLQELRQGDYLLIQWGHNDATAVRPNRYVAPADFEKWIQIYVDGAKQRGATPVLVTPVARYSYDTENQTFNEGFKKYGDVMRKMASEQNLPLIDLSQRSIALCNSFGYKGAEVLFLHVAAGEYPDSNYAGGATDDTHLQYYGAHKFAQCVAQGILDSENDALKELAKKIRLSVPEMSPGEVSGLSAKAEGSSSISLTWNEAKDAELYYIYRKELSAEDAAAVEAGEKTISFSAEDARYAVSSKEKYADSGCKADTMYAYAVRGFNGKGLSETFSNTAAAKTKAVLYQFDINHTNNSTMSGWTGVATDLKYTKELGYGWTKLPTKTRDRGIVSSLVDSNDMTKDFALDGEFAVDLPNGTYEVTFFGGDLMANGSTVSSTFYVDGKEAGSLSARRAIGKVTQKVTISDGQMNITFTGYFNGMTITELLKAPGGFALTEQDFKAEQAQMTAIMAFHDTNKEGLVKAYKVYLKSSAENKFNLYKEFTKEQLSADELACKSFTCDLGDTYQAYIACVTEDGTEAGSEIITIEAFDKSAALPAAPANVRCVSPESSADKLQHSVTIAWDAVKGASAKEDAFKYVIYRAKKIESANGYQTWLNREKGKYVTEPFEKIAETRETSYTDSDRITTNVSYYYKVAAVNISGMGPQSEYCVTNTAGELSQKNREKYTDRALVGMDLSGKSGAQTLVSAADQDGNEYTSGVYLSWRSFEADFNAEDKLTTKFTVYKNGSVLAGAENLSVTNLIDPNGSKADTYRVTGSNDAELGLNNKTEIKPWDDKYLEISLFAPADQKMPDGSICTYSANDMSVGDADGDGQLELIVKWYPSNAQDNSKSGYTGETFLDTYDVNYATGEIRLLSRINMGINIRSGAHYTQFQVWDFDGDGKAEIAVKTSDGTTSYATATGKAEDLEQVAHVGAVDNTQLSPSVQQTAAKYDYRNSSGHVIIGNEYFSVFNLDDGTKAADDVKYEPERGPVDNMPTLWGDGKKDNAGNRSERYLSGTAYLDGENPYAVFCRGYYERITLTAYYLKDTNDDGIGDTIDKYWLYDTGYDRTAEENVLHRSEGNHGLSINDVDSDGKDEIVYGSLIIDHDGTVLNGTGLGHGDALHVSDWVSWNKGLEVMDVHEHDNVSLHVEVHDAETGEVLMGYYTGKDTGRGAMADIDPTAEGAEWWSIASPTYESNDEPAWDSNKGEVYSSHSTMDNLVKLADTNPPANFTIFWDGDLLSEIQDHKFKEKDGYVPVGVNILKWNYETEQTEPLLYSEEIWSNNGTKGNVGLAADILGDWREEIITRTTDAADADGNVVNNTIRIYSTTIQTDYVVPFLMENLAYREGIAWQNVAYNQPANLDYMISEGLVTAQLMAGEIKTDLLAIDFTPANDGKYGHEITGYEVYRADVSDGKAGSYEKIADLPLGTLTPDAESGKYRFVDENLTSEKTYSYKIAAVVDKKTSYMSRSLEATTAVEVAQVDEIVLEDIVQNVRLEEGQTLADLLPKTVSVTSAAGDKKTVLVTWDVSSVAIDTPGTYDVRAFLQGYPDKPVTAKLTVIPNVIVSTNADKIEMYVGQKLEDVLPAAITATYRNGDTKEITVEWDTSNVLTVTEPTGLNPYTVTAVSKDDGAEFEAKLYIYANTITSSEEIKAEVEYGAEDIRPYLPTKTTITYSDGTTKSTYLKWDEEELAKVDTTKADQTFEIPVKLFGSTQTVKAKISIVCPVIRKFDFNTTDSGSKTPEGWIGITMNKSKGKDSWEKLGNYYTAEKKYGFVVSDISAAASQGRYNDFTFDGGDGLPKEVYNDLALVQNLTFAVDLPNGKYMVDFLSNSGTDNTSVFGTAEGNEFNVTSKKGTYAWGSAEADVQDGQLTIVFGDAVMRLGALVIRKMGPADFYPEFTEVPVSGIAIENGDFCMKRKGAQIQLMLKLAPEDVNVFDIIFTSDNEKAASVSEDGIVTANAPGETVITAASAGNPEISASCKVTVEKTAFEKADKTLLVEAIQTAQTFNEADYTEDSFAGLKTALTEAVSINEKEDATQEEVDTAVANIQKALNDLEKKPSGGGTETNVDKSLLAAAIIEAQLLNAANYTQESYAGLLAAIEKAILVRDNSNASKDEVDQALNALKEAKGALKEVNSTGGPTQGTETKPGTGSDDTDRPSTVPEIGKPVKAVTGDTKVSYTVTGKGKENTVAFTGTKSTKVVIPDTIKDADGNIYKVTSIAAKAFTKTNKKNITSLTIGNYITKIDKKQFSGFTKLKTVKIGNGVKSIGNSAFSGDKKLESVKIGNNVKTIGASAFSGDVKLKTVTFGKKITSIGSSAFKNCKALKNIKLPNSTKKINASAFAGCTSLSKVTIGTGLVSIGKEAFKGDTKLSSITIQSKKLSKVEKNAFKNINKKAKFKVPKGKASTYKRKYLNAKAGVTKTMTVK